MSALRLMKIEKRSAPEARLSSTLQQVSERTQPRECKCYFSLFDSLFVSAEESIKTTRFLNRVWTGTCEALP